jgi:hypothetical protein
MYETLDGSEKVKVIANYLYMLNVVKANTSVKLQESTRLAVTRVNKYNVDLMQTGGKRLSDIGFSFNELGLDLAGQNRIPVPIKIRSSDDNPDSLIWHTDKNILFPTN